MIKLFKKIKITIFVVLSFFIMNTLSVSALGTLILDPENPAPYDAVKVTFKTFDFDADNAVFTWSINKKIVLVGKGEKTLNTKVGGVGSPTQVDVKVEVTGGEVVNSSINLRPQVVDLIWESTESYVPPFYEGKALPSEDSEIKITALPSFSNNGGLIRPTDLSYSWYLNDQFIDNGSGYGRNVLKTRLDYLSNENIFKVVARGSDGSVAENRITILPNDISPVFYLKDPIFGIDFNHAIEKRFETTKEFTLAVVPYFISSKNGQSSGITYNWSMGGLPITPETDTTLTLRPKDNSYGSKILSLSIENTMRYLQKIDTALEIVFDTRK